MGGTGYTEQFCQAFLDIFLVKISFYPDTQVHYPHLLVPSYKVALEHAGYGRDYYLKVNHFCGHRNPTEQPVDKSEITIIIFISI
jgi:hypothetical protein